MYSIVKTVVLRGVKGILVQVEADLSSGMPMFEMVGFLSGEVKEAKDRVRIALKNSGIDLPPRRITINFTPGDIRKSGSWFDLPVAAAVLGAMGVIPKELFERALFVGELGLDGEILPVRGVLTAAVLARKQQLEFLFVPEKNGQEAAVLKEVCVIPVSSLREFIAVCISGRIREYACAFSPVQRTERRQEDFSDIRGQELVKRACEIAAGGMHNLLMIGPPGSGKTMMARRLPTILPDMDFEEMLELTQIYSISGKLKEQGILQMARPFVAPHHTITLSGMCGGGRYPVPGAVSLAHRGVLFLDEFPEFSRDVIESLRQPLEDGCISLHRMDGAYLYPSDFLLLAAMNPCRCGYYPDVQRCRCTQASVDAYRGKISKPILERIDLSVETREVPVSKMRRQKKKSETSAMIRKRVERAHSVQKERFQHKNYYFNSQMPVSDMEEFCMLSQEAEYYLEEAYEQKGWSLRSYYKVLRTARTIADLEESTEIKLPHVMEAAAYRISDWSASKEGDVI